MLKQSACDVDLYDDRDSAPSQVKNGLCTLGMHSSPCLPIFPVFFGGGVRLFGIVMGD